MKHQLFVITSTFFKPGVVELDDHTIFNNVGIFINEKPSKVNLALNKIATGLIIKDNGNYVTRLNSNKTSICHARYITKIDQAPDTITNARDNHIKAIGIKPNDIKQLGYLYDILKLENTAYFIFILDITGTDHNLPSLNKKILVDKYFSLDRPSRNLLNYLYENNKL